MNEIFSLAGSLLYVLVNVIIFPLVILLDCILALVTLAKQAKSFSRSMRRNVLRQKQTAYQYLVKRHLIIYKK